MDTQQASPSRGTRWARWGALVVAFAAGAGVTLIARPGLVAAAGAAGACRGHFGRGNPQAMREHAQVAVKWALRDAGASEEQQKKVGAIVDGALVDLQQMHEQREAMHDKAVAAVSADTVDREQIEALRASAVERMDEASKRIAKAVADAADVLTPAQRQALLARARELHR
jgi:periplasmic protein CpxP/Spy